MKSAACPSCASTMEQRFFDRKPSGKVELDFCFGCHAIWFDQYESVALAPGAVIELFRVIHEHRDHVLRPLADVLSCPSCNCVLALTQDFQRSNRISYYRCPGAHGRLTTFFQFLREKQFVRSLTGAEVAKLRETVKQVRCSSCGAPVDLARDAQCGYCRSPISILDPDAVRKTLAELDAQDRGSKLRDPREIVDDLLAGRRVGSAGPVDPDMALQAVLAGQRKRPAPQKRPSYRDPLPADFGGGNRGFVDLVSDALDFLTD